MVNGIVCYTISRKFESFLFWIINYHWKELKYRFYYWLISFISSIIIIWYYKFNILFSITDLNLIYTSLTEAFEVCIYFSIILSLLFNIPLLLYHYILFLIPGLYKFEYNNFILNILKYTLLLILFYYTSFYYILDNIIIFFTDLQSDYLILNLKIKDFISFFNSYILGFLFLFSLPFININLNKKRSIIYITFLILIAFITPPDIFSLIILILPIIIVLELKYFINLINLS